MPADAVVLVVRAAPGRTRAVARLGDSEVPVALGRAGIRDDKREGDGATPSGVYRLTRVYYRPDRLERPDTALPVTAIDPNLGWCDDPADPANYNRPIRLPYTGSHERMWRDDHLYDLVVEIDHNAALPIPGLGSAVFLHLAQEDWSATEGCVAFNVKDLRRLILDADQRSMIDIASMMA